MIIYELHIIHLKYTAIFLFRRHTNNVFAVPIVCTRYYNIHFGWDRCFIHPIYRYYYFLPIIICSSSKRIICRSYQFACTCNSTCIRLAHNSSINIFLTYYTRTFFTYFRCKCACPKIDYNMCILAFSTNICSLVISLNRIWAKLEFFSTISTTILMVRI